MIFTSKKFLLGSLLASCVFAMLFANCQKTEETPSPEFTGLSAQVEVIRDKNGVAHIYGEKNADVFYAAGYECARDRLFQMDMLRRQASGQLAEVYGAQYQKKGGDKVENVRMQDILMRSLGLQFWAEKAAQEYKKKQPELYRLLDAYARGVSNFIQDASTGKGGLSLPYGFGPGELDYKPAPWTVADSLVVGKLQSFGVSQSVTFEMMASFAKQLMPDKTLFDDLIRFAPPDPTFILDGWPGIKSSPLTIENDGLARQSKTNEGAVIPQLSFIELLRRKGFKDEKKVRQVMATLRHILRTLPGSGGSNNWAVAGKHSSTGKSMLANDPHLAITNPSSFYMIHMHAKEGLHVAGASMPGVPFILVGHNEKMAWGITTARTDVSDIYVENLSDGTVTRGGKKLKVQRRKEILKVRLKGKPVSQAEVEEIDVDTVSDAVLLGELPGLPPPELFGGNRIRVHWTGMAITNESLAFWKLATGKALDDFKGALSDFHVGALNFVCITDSGDLGYYARANYPIRKKLDKKHPPWLILPTEGFDFSGKWIPDVSIAQSFNPSSGLLFSANNDPVGTTKDNDPLNDKFYLSPLFSNGFRAGRVKDRLEAALKSKKKITPEDMKKWQMDVHSRLADRLVPQIVKSWKNALAAKADKQPRLAALAKEQSLQEAIAILEKWDRKAAPESPGAALFYTWLPLLGRRMLRDDVPGVIYDQAVPAYPDILIRPIVFLLEGGTLPSGRDFFDDKRTTAVKEGKDETVLLGVKDAIAHIKDIFPKKKLSEMKWGDFHRIQPSNRFGQKFELGPFPGRGGFGTLNAAQFELTGGPGGSIKDKMNTYHGTNLRFVAWFDKEGRIVSEFVLLGGQSGVPGAKHFGDMMPDWMKGNFRKLPFYRKDVEAMQAKKYTFPAKSGAK